MRTILGWLQELAGLIVFLIGGFAMIASVSGFITSIHEPSILHAAASVVFFAAGYIVARAGWFLASEA